MHVAIAIRSRYVLPNRNPRFLQVLLYRTELTQNTSKLSFTNNFDYIVYYKHKRFEISGCFLSSFQEL